MGIFSRKSKTNDKKSYIVVEITTHNEELDISNIRVALSGSPRTIAESLPSVVFHALNKTVQPNHLRAFADSIFTDVRAMIRREEAQNEM